MTGLARFASPSDCQGRVAMLATMGYIAPEYSRFPGLPALFVLSTDWGTCFGLSFLAFLLDPDMLSLAATCRGTLGCWGLLAFGVLEL